MKKETRKTLEIYWFHFKKYKFLIFVMLFFLMTTTIMDLAIPYLYKIFFDSFTLEAARDTLVTSLVGILLWIVLASSINWIFYRGFGFSLVYLESGVMGDIYRTCFEYLHQHSYRFFSDNFSGSLVKKVGRFVRSFETYVDKLFFDMIPLFFKIMVMFFIMLWIKPAIGITILLWSMVFMLSTLWFTSFKWKYDLARAGMDTKVSGLLADTITNNSNLKFFANLSYEIKSFGKVINQWIKATVTSWNLSQVADALQGIMMIGLEFLILYFAIQGWGRGELTLGDIVWAQSYVIELMRNISRFGRNIRDIYSSLSDAEEMTVIFDQRHEIRDLKKAKNIHIIRAAIEFKNVNFSYTSEDTDVLKDLSFKIKSGEKVALVGPSGGGKTTLTKLILRLFDIQKGRILIDGQDIKKVTQDSLRSQISFVPQDPILFHRSIMENIRYGRLDASDEEVMAAARMANCHDFILSFSRGYDTFVGERGIKLSGGEKQRVAIARAILANNQLLILDEATSSLDSASEALIQDALNHLMKNKTTLVIAHRLSTITRMDRILVLQNGSIVEDGIHSDLIQQKSGLYKKLWDLQVGGYID